MNQVIAAIKFLLKAYFGGCFGCLGVLSAVIILIVVFALTLGPQVLGALQGIQLPAIPLPSGPGGPPSGPPGGPGTPLTPAPTPTGTLPPIEVWFTKENRPDAEHITTFKFGGLQDVTAYIWAKGPKGANVAFEMWIVFPDGKRERFGPPNQQFRTNPDGNPVGTGTGGPPPMKGTFKLEAVIGTTTVGSTTITVQ